MKLRNKIISLFIVFAMALCGALANVKMPTAQADSTINLTIEARNVSYSDSLYLVYAVSSQGFDTNEATVKLLFWDDVQGAYELGTEKYQVSAQKETVTVKGKECLAFYSRGIAAKNMTDDVYTRAYVQIDGTVHYSEVQKFSVLEYAHLMLERNTDSDLDNDLSTEQTNLMNALLNYGAAAQKLFGYNLDKLANDTYYSVQVENGVISDGFTSGRYKEGQSVVITANEPAEGQKFLCWLDVYGYVVSDQITYEFTMPSEAMQFVAVYDIIDENDYILQVENGTLSNGETSGIYKSGDREIITANASSAGMEFSHWEDENGNIVSTESVFEVTINHADATYIAIYKEITDWWHQSNNAFPFPLEWAGIEVNSASTYSSLMRTSSRAITFSQAESTINLAIEARNVSYSDSLYLVYAVSSQGFDTSEATVKLLFWDDVQGAYELGTEKYQVSAQKETVTVKGKECLAFYSRGIAAKNMTDDIYARAYVEIDGTIYYSEVQKFSVLEYAHLMLERNSDDNFDNDLSIEQTNLMRALLDYGAAAQKLFGYNLDRLANDTYYSVQVENGVISDGFTSGRYAYGDKVTIIADAIPEGLKFAGWKDSNGNVVSTNMTYELTVAGSEKYTATYKEKTVIGNISLTSKDLSYNGNVADILPSTISFDYDGEMIELAVTWLVSGFDAQTIGEQNVYATLVDSSAYAEYGVGEISLSVNVLPYSLELNSAQKYILTAYYGDETEFTIPSTYYGVEIVEVGANAFANNTSLTSVTIPANVTNIESSAFYNCTLLESVTFGANNQLTSIGSYAFWGCISLTSVTVPASVTSIGASAFFDCISLASVTFGANSQLTNIDSYSFLECISLTSIEIPESVKIIDLGAFSGCTLLASVTFGANSQLANIGAYAFEKCTSLTSINIPNSVTSIGDSAFYRCTSLTSITVDAGNPNYKDIDGNLYSKDGTTLIQYAIGKTATEFTIPESVTSIDKGAFSRAYSLESIIIPETIVAIGEYAFSGCDNLTIYCEASSKPSGWSDNWNPDNCPVVWGFADTNGVEYTLINDDTEYGVSRYTGTSMEVVILSEYRGKPVTKIIDSAFASSAITSIEIPASIKVIGNGAFNNCTALTKVNFLGTIDQWAEITFGNTYSSPTRISKCLYINNELVTKINLTTATKISARAFYQCENITSIEISSAITSIGEYAFRYCKALESIDIPDTVESIGQYAFADCTVLETVVLPNSLTSLESHLFMNCKALSSIEIPRTVTNIADLVFYNTTALTTIYIPISVETMGAGKTNGVIRGCSTTLKIYCEADSRPSGWATQWNFNDRTHTWGYASLINQAVSAIDAIGNVTLIDASAINAARTAYEAIDVELARMQVTNYAKLVKAEQELLVLTSKIDAWKDQVDAIVVEGNLTVTNIDQIIAVEAIYNGWLNSSDALLRQLAVDVAQTGSTYSYDKYESLVVAKNAILSEITSIADQMSALSTNTSIISKDPIAFNNAVLAVKNVFESLDSSFKTAYFTNSGAQYRSAYDNYNQALALYNNVYNLIADIINLGDPTQVTLDKYAIVYSYINRYNALSDTYKNIVIDGGFKQSLDIAKQTVDELKEANDDGFDYVLINNGTAYEIVGYRVKTKNVVVPREYDGIPVVSIAEYAFNGLAINSVEIQDNITNIGEFAFNGCASLTTVTLGRGVTSIPYAMFNNCIKLQTVVIEGNVNSIGDYAFYNCKSLSSIILPSTVSTIGNYAFYQCTSLTSITIPEAATYVGYRAFTYCNSLTIYCVASKQPSDWDAEWNSTNCPVVWDCNYSNTDADGYIYVNSNGIKYGIKDGVATVVKQPSSITSANIASSIDFNGNSYEVTSIEARAFYGCALTSVVIAEGIASIGDYAFYNCDSLVSVTIPSSVNNVGKYAFSQCDKLQSVSLPTSVEKIGSYAFSGCPKLVYTVENGIKYLGNSSNPYVYLAEITDNTMTSVVINNRCRIIGSYIFTGAEYLTSIEIPESVVYMGHEVFYQCPVLTIRCQAANGARFEEDWNYANSPVVWNCANNEVADDGYIYAVVGGVRYALSNTTGKAMVVRQPKNITSASITDTVRYNGSTYIVNKICDYAFYNCSSITTVSLSNNLEYVGMYAFDGCNLTYNKSGNLYYLGSSTNPYLYLATTDAVTISSPAINANCKFIGDRALVNAKLMTSVTIPASIINIGASAFSGRSSLRTITFASGSQLKFIGNYAFNGCSSSYLTSIVIPNSVEYIGSSAFVGCISLTSITLPSSLTSIEAFTFEGCTKLSSIYIPSTVQYISYFAFNECTALKYVTIDADSEMTYIDDCAFLGCTNLLEITIPDSVTHIGIKAFKDCSSLQYVTLSSNLTAISDYTFLNCSKLIEIVIPSGVQKIGVSAFEECTSLVSVTFEEYSQVTIFDENAFYKCSSLESMIVPDSVLTIGRYALSYCSALSSLTLGNNLTKIGYEAFSNCTRLTSFIIPKSVTTVEYGIVAGCTSLTKVYCRASSRPAGWHSQWNWMGSKSAPVTWRYSG